MANNNKYCSVTGDENGNIYEGHWQNGKLNGREIRMPNGDKYVGQLKDNKPHGNGVLRKNNGDMYEGTFKNGSFKEGKRYFNNGGVFVGEFDDNTGKGRGTYYYPDGSMLTCALDNDNIFGTFTDKSGVQTTGTWNNEGFNTIHNFPPITDHKKIHSCSCKCPYDCIIF